MLRAATVLLLTASLAAALTAEQVAVLVNLTDPDAQRVAEHYCRLRGVPAGNVLSVSLPAGETLPRAVYEAQLLPAVRTWLSAPERAGRIRCLLLVYGLPLKVGNRTPTAEQSALAATLKPQLDAANAAVKANQDRAKALRDQATRTDAETAELAALNRQLPDLRRTAGELEQRYAPAAGRETTASLDSELALAAWPGYDTYRWVVNVLNFAFPREQRAKAPPVYYVARLDGPTPEVAMRLVTDAVQTEQTGLQGKVYLDARGIRLRADHPDWYGYGGYDESLRDLAKLLGERTKLEVVLDDQPALFGPGCADVALYCGWYQLAKYQDSFTFRPGAVAYHIASAEATTLRNPDSNVWCKRLLEHGVAATLGPVAEPYTIGFPKPYEFFAALLTGQLSLVETYAVTLQLQSWMTTLIGDPLYNPFRAHPQLPVDVLRPSPPGCPPLWQAQDE